ncbi:hypothetical protein [Ascidiaceihabitans sp.]|uniref:hypothetical protein n=1 Tax=Ascidiaceihabitans sp. TaxID=1872644 RepID=UPI00329739B0
MRTASFVKRPEQGASTTVWAATATVLDGKAGVYCEDCDVAAATDPDGTTARFAGVNAPACDDNSAERLWALSQDMMARAHQAQGHQMKSKGPPTAMDHSAPCAYP